MESSVFIEKFIFPMGIRETADAMVDELLKHVEKATNKTIRICKWHREI